MNGTGVRCCPQANIFTVQYLLEIAFGRPFGGSQVVCVCCCCFVFVFVCFSILCCVVCVLLLVLLLLLLCVCGLFFVCWLFGLFVVVFCVSF
jgi:hypothetical protein